MTGTILIADGDSERARRISEACSARGLQATVATHGAAALEAALAEPPAVLVVQLGLPLIDGAQLGGILRANPRTQSVSVIFLLDRSIDAERSDLDGEVFPRGAEPEAVARAAEARVAETGRVESQTDPDDDDGGGVEGQLSQISLSDLLQLFHVSRRTGAVELARRDGHGGSEIGRVLLRAGEVVHAAVGPIEHEKALYRLLAWERGNFSFHPTPVAVEPRIEQPTRSLLREGLRQLREWERLAVALPGMEAQVRLTIDRASLPRVIHPLTHEVLLALEMDTRVRDVVDRCSFPDYQVLRTLHTLIERGMVELRTDAPFAEDQPSGGLFSPVRGTRLREWLGHGRPRAEAARDAKLLVIAADASATLEFARLLGALPRAEIEPRIASGNVARHEIGRLGRLGVDGNVGIEFVQLPASERFAPLWPVGGHGALGILLLLTGSVVDGVKHLRPAVEALRQLPRARIYHLLMLEKGTRVEPDALRENLALFDQSSLFLVPLDKPEKSSVLLREMFVRILP